MMLITYLGEIYGELSLTAMSGQIWGIPFLVYLNVVDTTKVNRWIIWTVTTLMLSYPNGKPRSTVLRETVLTGIAQRIPFKSVGTLEIRTQCARARFRPQCTICSSKRVESSLRTFTAPVRLSPSRFEPFTGGRRL